MANPFFIPDQTAHNTEPLNQAIGNYLRFKGITEQARLGDQSNQRMLEQNLLTAQNQQAQRANDEAKLKESQRTFSAAHIRPYLTNITGRKVDKHWQPLTDVLLQNVANKNITAGIQHDDIAQNFETVYKPLIRNALLAEAQAAPEGTDLKEYDKKLQAIEEMTGEQAAKSILPGVWNERQNERAAVEGQKSAERAAMLNPETQAYRAFFNQAKRQGMTDEDAAVAATDKFGTWKANMTKEGKFPPINVRVDTSGQITQTIIPDANSPTGYSYTDKNGNPKAPAPKQKVEGTQRESASEKRRRERAERRTGTTSYKTADEVKAAHQQGKLSREQALTILKRDFRMQ